MVKSAIALDTLGVWGVYGSMGGFAASMKSNAHLSDISKYAAEQLAEEFGDFSDAWSASHGDQIRHMYEWNMSGVPQGRLFELLTSGAGKNKTVTFTYLPSKVPVPVPEELLEPGPNDQVVQEGVHIFKNKAMVMEMGQTVTIVPKNAKALAFVPMQTDKRGNERPTFKQRAVLTPGQEVQGNFTAVWTLWWDQIAPEVWEKKIVPGINKGNADAFSRVNRTNRRSTFAIRNTTNGQGNAEASKMYKKTEREILKVARRRLK